MTYTQLIKTFWSLLAKSMNTFKHSTPRAVQVAFLFPDQSWSSTATSPAEILHGMSMNVQDFQNSQFKGFETIFLRSTEHEVRGFSGISIETRCIAEPDLQEKQFDVVIIPSVWDLSLENLRESTLAFDWLRLQHASGAIVAGVVTGVFYLAEAGLLDERSATIHWASVNIFKQRYPQVKVTPQLQLVEADRVITTSSTPATFDLALMIVQRFFGDRAAEYAAHYFRIRDKDAPLPAFMEPSCNDTLVDAARDSMRVRYAESLSLDDLATLFNVTSRTLTRRFVNATGISPIQYLNKQRLNVARNLLQSTDLQIQQIAEQSGFGSATVFCRHFKKAFSQTPREFRDTLPTAKLS